MKQLVILILLGPVHAGDIHLSTPDDREYVELSTHCVTAADRSSWSFKVKAKHDAHVALMSARNTSYPLYEIVLGGWSNNKSCIRAKEQGPTLSFHIGPVLDENMYVPFWISWTNGNISVGRSEVVGGHLIMTYQHSNPYSVNFLGIMTGFGSTGEWVIQNDVSCNLEVYNNTRILTNNSLCLENTIYECDPGYYILQGNLQRTCLLNKTWSGSPPVCERITCPLIASTNNYTVQRQNNDIGGNVTVYCAENFRHSSGQLTRQCSSDGTWEGGEPVCSRCMCPCSMVNRHIFNSTKALYERIEQLKRIIKVEKNSTNAFYRTKVSIRDDRPSSARIGYLLGYGVITLFLSAIVLSDVLTFYRQI